MLSSGCLPHPRRSDDPTRRVDSLWRAPTPPPHAAASRPCHPPTPSPTPPGQVINRLIRREHVLAESFVPEAAPGESDADYARRAQDERVLTLHAGFNPDP